MAIPQYLAMTAAEFSFCDKLPAHLAWMACHFSNSDSGLSNLPQVLPEGSLLILNDRMPLQGHDAASVCAVLGTCAENLKCSGILLDFQRPFSEEMQNMVASILELPFPVGVSQIYADNCSAPVFLPPVPPYQSIETYLQPWQNREIWLEFAMETACLTLTEAGCDIQFSRNRTIEENPIFAEETLCCHYQIETEATEARFFLHRTQNDLHELLHRAEKCGVCCAIGLWQELHELWR